MAVRLDGVRRTELHISRRTRLRVHVKEGKWVDPAALIREIGKEKYRHWPDDVRLTVTGTIQRAGQGWRLQVSGEGAPVFDLREPERKDGKPGPLAEEAPLAGTHVEVEALWRVTGGKDPQPYLLVEKVKRGE